MDKEYLVELCDRYKAGDNSAYEELYHACYLPTYRFAFGLTKRKAESEDLAHEAFLKLARNINTLNSKNILAWLFTVVRNSFYDSLRKEKKFTGADIQEEITASNRKAETDLTSVDTDKLLDSLSATERELIMLRFWEGYDMKQISKITGKSHAATRKEISRIIKKLRLHN